MKKLKNALKLLTLVMILAMVSPVALPISNAVVAQAATVKISKKKVTLEVGKTKKLKITGTKSKVKWSSSKKSVATVSKSGKVTAKKAGKATITATVNNKKYKCKVTVVKPENPYVSDAPFDAQELSSNNVNYVIPKNWKSNVIAEQNGVVMVMFYPDDADANKGYSNVSLTIQETGADKSDYSLLKEYYESYITKDLIKTQLAQSGIEATISDFTSSDYEAKLGTAYKTDYKVNYDGGSMTQTIYDLNIDNYLIEVTVTDIGDDLKIDVNEVGEYLLNSVHITE